MNAPEPVSPKPRLPGQREALCHELQRAIILGQLHPRERLVEDEIIARSGATRHAVRRALDELERLGLVIRHPNRGVRVRDYTITEVEDLYEIRTCLERQAALRYALPANPAFLGQLRQIAKEHAKLSRRRQFIEMFALNNKFHDMLYSGAGNEALADAIRHFTFATHPIRMRGFPDDELREAAIADHGAMVAAVETGNRARLASLVVEHIMRPMRFYIACAINEAPPGC
ncbi:MAG TPA: GntR family transcriptional regulator [Acidiphilium sp.]